MVTGTRTLETGELERLRTDMVAAAGWLTGVAGLSRLLLFARTLIAARLIGPEQLGVFGAALVIMGIAEALTQTGFRAAIIQKHADDAQTLNTAWTIHAARGLLMTGGLILFAPLAGALFHDPGLTNVVRIISVCMLINGLANVSLILFEKDLQFKQQFRLTVFATVVELAASVVALSLARNAWALVAGAIAGYLARTVGTYWLHPYRPRFFISSAKARVLFGYGKWALVAGMLVFTIEYLDSVAVGRRFGPHSLGIYQMASRIMNIPATQLVGVVGAIAFPAFSRMNHDTALVRLTFGRFAYGTLAVAVPVTGWLTIVLKPLIEIVLGPAWFQSIGIGQILSLYVIARLLGWCIGPVFEALGRPDYVTKLAAFHLTLLSLSLWMFGRAGDLGRIAWIVVAAMLVTQVISAALAVRLIGYSVRELGSTLGLPLGATAAAMTATTLVRPGNDAFWSLIILTIVFGVVYAVVFELLARWRGRAGLGLLAKSVLWARPHPRAL